MSRTTQKMQNVAKLLIASKISGEPTPKEERRTASSNAFELLRPQLATLMGVGGFRALIQRAIALADDEIPWLKTVEVKEDGGIEGWEKIYELVDRDSILQGQIILLAQLLDLLVAFIGENLTMQLVSKICPSVPLGENWGKQELP